ncbi:MAG TPA: hypothetical protein VLG09_04320 [Candidatus Saccharimonadales bacterium]|nr:hypothetical protein [Candidatus Saccharimonadales bacterium]
MSVNVRSVGATALQAAIVEELTMTEDDKLLMYEGLKVSAQIFVGRVDEGIACIWGIVTPTILSTRAGIWMYTTPLVKDHPFIFVRHSQMIVQELLKEYETIEGNTNIHAEHSKRWLRWLGASFYEPQGDLVKFVIRRKTNGL